MARGKGNPQVLLVKQIIRAFCRFVKAHKAIGYDLVPKSRRYFAFEDEMMGRSCSALPLDVPKGHCAVYVGNERSRFIIPTDYLNHSLFRALLEKSEEEYGFDHQMGLSIPCDEVAFQSLTALLQKNDPALGNLGVDELMKLHS
ncbi:protein SMALL AUXIN UP-REGULATED RNA 51 [Cryptomeria japonica]|uniref:protein SMALL AUXIN UP-REGULATED RNA 51 n=1 Tax=Cryptomeria japonica TaxID=3369 RepID=UPI0027DA824B|nr:protein SMALL AUXIN UP-REGULATED RNA 51 [Cryptomeria japonica]